MADIIWKDVEKLAIHNVSALVVGCENYFSGQLERISQDILSDREISLVLLAGPSASGKTTSANILGRFLEAGGVKVHRLSTDDYFFDRDTIPFLPSGLRDFDSIRAVNVPLLQQHILTILNGGTVVTPRFDFKEGKSFPDGEVIEMSPVDIVIIEGIHALNPVLTAWCGDVQNKIKRISIAPMRTFKMEGGFDLVPDDLRLLRRLIRDYYTRGHEIEATVKQWKEVREGERKYVLPYVAEADYRVDSVHEYELIVYKQCVYSKIKDNHLSELTVIRRALSEVNSMVIDTIPEASLLNEFVHYDRLAK